MKNLYRQSVRTLPAFGLLKMLKPHYRLLALTNISKEWLEYKNSKYHLEDYFEVIVSSAEEKVAKPKEEIYKRLIEETSIKVDESVFIDGLACNVKAAKAIGFNVIIYKNKKDLKARLRKFGVFIN